MPRKPDVPHPYQPLDHSQALGTLSDCDEHLPADVVSEFHRGAFRLVRQRRGPTLGLWDLTGATRNVLSALYAVANARWVACLTVDEIHPVTGCGRNDLAAVLAELQALDYVRVLGTTRAGKTVRLFQLVPIGPERLTARPEGWSPKDDRRSYRTRTDEERAAVLQRLKDLQRPAVPRAALDGGPAPVPGPAADAPAPSEAGYDVVLNRVAALNECLAAPAARAIAQARESRDRQGRAPLPAKDEIARVVAPLEKVEWACEHGELTWTAAKHGVEEAEKRGIAGRSGRFGEYAATVARNAHRHALAARTGRAHESPERLAEQKINDLLLRAREANKAGNGGRAQALLGEALQSAPLLASLIGSSELAEAHIRDAFKKGLRDVMSAPRTPSLSDYEPAWTWPAHLPTR